MPSPPHGDEMRLPADVQAVLLAAARRTTLARGEALFRKGSLPDALFGVLTGQLRVSVVSASGREAVIALLDRDQWFGEVSLFVGAERVYDTCAVEDAEIAVVPAAAFHHLVATRPDVHLALTRLVCYRLRHALAWIDDAILMPLPVRLAHRLLALASAGTDALGVSQEELAFMLGVSRQSINRQLGLWQDQGLVRTSYGRIELVDPDALARLAAQG
jgi:CRP/FNR family transcriptional regulator, cyclic AMP receptor protein